MKAVSSISLSGAAKTSKPEVIGQLGVLSLALTTVQVVPILPSRTWSSPHSDSPTNGNDAQPSLLGLSMRICEPESASENVWHVLDVIEGSPAESAGLVPMGDWILGKRRTHCNHFLINIGNRLVWGSTQRRKRLLRCCRSGM